MSAILVKFSMNNRDPNLNTIERFILCRLSEFSNDEGSQVFPSLSRLSVDLGCSRSTVSKYIKTLRDKEYITVVKEGCRISNRSTEYQLSIKKIKSNSCYNDEIVIDRKKTNAKIFPINSVDKFVDNSSISVDNPVDKKIPYTATRYRAIPPRGTGLYRHADTISHIISHNNSHYDKGGATTNFLKRDEMNVRERLKGWKVVTKDIDSWLQKYGEGYLAEKINSIACKSEIYNPGAVLRNSLTLREGGIQ